MKVVLAGYNVDAGVLDDAKSAGIQKNRLTPEVLSAAYARISRDPREVTELRRIALEEVEKARKSNRSIIFQMGHHSVAEHAVFNFDIIGLSRLAMEWLERFRLCSFTEKSQRYITLDNDFIIPQEIAKTPYEPKLLSLLEQQSALYNDLNETLQHRLFEASPDMAKTKRGRILLEGAAKEDARYVTILATTGQLGLTVNARNLELLIRRFAASPLEEIRTLGKTLYKEGAKVAPSLLLFTEPSPNDSESALELAKLASELIVNPAKSTVADEAIRLVGYTENADRIVAASLLNVHSDYPFDVCRQTVDSLSQEMLKTIFEAAMRRMEFYDSTPREFEHVTLTYELVLSASAFAQLKRHRMSTQSVQRYTPELGLTIPPAISQIGRADDVQTFALKAETLYRDLLGTASEAADYVLTNAHRRRVLVSTNLRELYHIVRLREDAHAQWDIRKIAQKMKTAAEKVMPLGSLLLCGKDSFVERYKTVFGENPKIIPPK